MSDTYSLGIDTGAVSMKFIVLDGNNQPLYKAAIKNRGDLIKTLRSGLENLISSFKEDVKIKSAGVTGSGRQLIGALIKADVIKNEITAHSTGTLSYYPDASTIIEIGGQDSKIILIEDGVPVDFEMSGVCGSGTGSFLEQQASRLDIKLSEFGKLVRECKYAEDTVCQFGGGCGIFIESAIIRIQQMGTPIRQIVSGLCDSVVTNYLYDTARGKKIKEPVFFQGGVAANEGILRSFEKRLGLKVTVPDNYLFLGAIGVAILAKGKYDSDEPSNLNFQEILDRNYQIKEYICEECEKDCRITEVIIDHTPAAILGKRCNNPL